MAITTEAAKKAMLAYHRFGLGPKPGGLAKIAADPKAALLEELETAGIAEINDARLPTYAQACYEGGLGLDEMGSRPELMRKKEQFARVTKHLEPEIGFVERLVMFFTNHFSMSVAKNQIVRATIGQWERDVVRRHVLGNFGNMLLGTITHPAMVCFLDNQASIGPNSIEGFKLRREDYTENLAREILELHTLATGNYRESDVAALAKLLTGWSYVRAWEANDQKNGGSDANRGQFIFRSTWHEQGPVLFRGKVYADTGRLRGEAALRSIAKSGHTARHIAYKLVRHFITDNPTTAMVDPVRRAFYYSGGNLKTTARALINLPAAWSTPMTRLRQPIEYSTALFRAAGLPFTTDGDAYIWNLSNKLLRQPLWQAHSPEGFPDEKAAWMTAEAMARRFDLAQSFAERFAPRITTDIPKLAEGLYGNALSFATRERVMYGGSPRAQLTILFACPEIHKR